MSTHPLLLGYNQTFEYSFPLILIIGREPNTDSVSDGSLGYYDFLEVPRCAFWNVAFNILGQANGVNTKEIKQCFLKHRASPIVFADAFPSGIKNVVADKFSIRKLKIELAEQQTAALFNNTQVIERVKLVILSGLENPVYMRFRNLVRPTFEKKGTKVKDAPFFYPTNTLAIQNSFLPTDRESMFQIFNQFLIETSNLQQ